MRGKHTSLNKDEKAAVRFLEEFYPKILLGPFVNCRHRYKAGHFDCVRDDVASVIFKIYSGDGLRKVTCMKSTEDT